MPDFLLPDLGEGLTEAEIVSWQVQVGDEVAVDQIVVELETAKAAVEVPVPFGGTVSVLHAEVGEKVTVGGPLISVVASTPAGRGSVFTGAVDPPTTRRKRPRSVQPPAAAPGARAAGPSVPADRSSDSIAVSSPLLRQVARDAALDLRTVAGSGPAGRVTRFDVEEALREAPVTVRRLATPQAEKVTRSRREIPEATVWVDVDATALLGARTELNRRTAQPVSVLALLARFVVAGLRLHPELNGRVEGEELVLSTAVHLGFAAQTDRGLVVPVVRQADRMTTRELAAAMAARLTSARAGTLTPADLSGGSFTVNNYGVFGVDGSAAIINFPEVAILGIGRIIDKPWVFDGAVTVRKVTQLTLAFDHRVCDGGTAGGFLRFVADCVESPAVALGEL